MTGKVVSFITTPFDAPHEGSKIKLANSVNTTTSNFRNRQSQQQLPSPFAPRVHHDNLLDELTENRQDYVAGNSNDPFFTITSMPNLLEASIKRCISSPYWRETNQRKPGYSAVCSCGITIGLRQLSANSTLEAVKNLKSEIYAIPCESARLDEAHSMASNFVLGSMDALTGIRDKRNIQLNSETKMQLGETAVELGLSATKFAIVCLVYAFRSQPFVLPGHQTLMHEMVEKFLLRAQTRVEISNVLIAWLRKEAEMQPT